MSELEHGRIVASSHGEFVVDRSGRNVVLISRERIGAAVIVVGELAPCFTVTDRFAPNRVRTERNETAAAVEREEVTNAGYPGVTGGRDPNSSRDPDQSTPVILPVASSERPSDPDPSAFDARTLGGMRPGSVRMIIGAGELRWTPCLTRAADSIWEHCWFLDRGESLYCHECRTRKPIAVVGPASAIASIRDALAAGELATAHELVRRLRTPSILPQVAQHERAVVVEADTFEQPIVVCPVCRKEHEDFDGFGVVSCVCGYCKHLSRDGDVCNYCGHRPARSLEEWHELFHERVAIMVVDGMAELDAKERARMLVGEPPRKVA